MKLSKRGLSNNEGEGRELISKLDMQRRYEEFQNETPTSTYNFDGYVALIGYKYDEKSAMYVHDVQVVNELDSEAFGVILRLYDGTLKDLVNR